MPNLSDVDPAAAARIAPQDAQRLQRALEVYRITGVADLALAAAHAAAQAHIPLDALCALAKRARAAAAALAVALRSDAAAGLVDEVRALYARGDLTPRHASMRAVGYRQLWLSLRR